MIPYENRRFDIYIYIYIYIYRERERERDKFSRAAWACGLPDLEVEMVESCLPRLASNFWPDSRTLCSRWKPAQDKRRWGQESWRWRQERARTICEPLDPAAYGGWLSAILQNIEKDLKQAPTG